MMFLQVIPSIVMIFFVGFVVKRLFSKNRNQSVQGGEIRRFFQYGLLFALTIISSIGTAGLLGRLLPIGSSISSNSKSLAMESSFAVVGIPLLILIIIWCKKTISKNSNELLSFGWNLYLTAITTLSLIFVINAQVNVYDVIFDNGVIYGKYISQLIVWGFVWVIHFRLHNEVEEVNSIGSRLVGSLIGLGYCFVGLTALFESLITFIFSFGAKPLIVDAVNATADGVKALLIGVPIWYIYWMRTAAKARKESLWYVYVLLIGVGGGLIVAIITAAFALYSVLVWFFGDTQHVAASDHFTDLQASLAATSIALIVMLYHREVLKSTQTPIRSEIQRVYDYVISGIGLIAASSGVTMVLVSIFESLFYSVQIAGIDSKNSLIAAITLFLVGGPVWWIMWRSVQKNVSLDKSAEQSSLVRRIYLFLLFGASAVAAVITLLISTYTAFEDLFKGEIGRETLRSNRFSVGILITAISVATYHWQIYKYEKDIEIQHNSESLESEKQHILVEFTTKPRKSKEFISLLSQYAVQVRKEDGCERFDILQDSKAKNKVYLYDTWRDKKSHRAHQNTTGFLEWKESVGLLLDGVEIKNLK